MYLKILTVLALIVVSTAAHVGAVEVYSVNSTTDELVTINPATGTVTVIGAIGKDMVDVDLTFHNGVLYAIDHGGSYPDTVDLVTINHNTGSMISSVHLTNADTLFLTNAAEGFTSVNGQLIISFDRELPVGTSDHLGELALDGEVSNEIDYYTTYNADMDALGTDPSNQIFSVDVVLGTGNDVIHLYEVDRSPQDYRHVGSFSGPNHSINDITFFGSNLFGVDRANGFLYCIDAETGALLYSRSLNPSGYYSGLAFDPEDIPTLSQRGLIITVLLLLTGGAIYIGWRRRRAAV